MNRASKLLAFGACLLAVCLPPGPARSAGLHDAPTVESAYPGLSAGPLSLARLGELPGGAVLRVAEEGIEITAEKIDQGIAEVASSIQDELKQNRFYVLEQTAADAILRKLALKDRQAAGTEAPSADAQEMVRSFLEQVAGAPEVTAEEVVTFYQNNIQLCGGAPLDQVRNDIQYVLATQKKQAVVDEYIRTLGQRLLITVSAAWVEEQAATALDNPLDRARQAGTPVLAVFSGASCCGPDATLPLLKEARQRYGDRILIVHIEARDEPILSLRYRANSIPTWLFFGPGGRETGRHVGSLDLEDIITRLTKMGVKANGEPLHGPDQGG